MVERKKSDNNKDKQKRLNNKQMHNQSKQDWFKPDSRTAPVD
jgi:hypothetical protein